MYRPNYQEEGLAPLRPISFFHISGECRLVEGNELPPIGKDLAPYLLAETSSLCYEEHFGDVAVGWNRDGIAITVVIKQPISHVVFPEVTRGDCVEIFIDTRDIKTSGFNTRFCHHFYFLPQKIDGHQAGETTHFRTEDSHPLCDPSALVVKEKATRNSYSMQIFIPSQCLHGYDPDQFNRLGFSYRLSRPDGGQQHFSAVSEEYKLEQQPSLWSSLQLIK